MILEQKSMFLILIHLPLTFRQGDLQSIMIKFASQCGFELVRSAIWCVNFTLHPGTK